MVNSDQYYLGRYAPTPSGFLHKGHASTFATVLSRAKSESGRVLLRIEDLDEQRCNAEYEQAIYEDMKWLGLNWDGEVVRQSERLSLYRETLQKLIELGLVYPSTVSRRQIKEFPNITKSRAGEVIFPEALREDYSVLCESDIFSINWRFKTCSGEAIQFMDERSGLHKYRIGEDFGDFLVWTKSGFPSYELAVVVDDIAQGITEVVRGEDLLVSTARQLLLYSALQSLAPKFYHCPLVTDDEGVRLAKSYDSESVRSYRERGCSQDEFWRYLRKN